MSVSRVTKQPIISYLVALNCCELNWQSYTKQYKPIEAFWNLTKQRAITTDNVAKLQKMLQILHDQLISREWNHDAEENFTELLYQNNLIAFFKHEKIMDKYKLKLLKTNDPIEFGSLIKQIYKEMTSGMGSKTANARIIISFANRLGLLYKEEKFIRFTEIGEELLQARSREKLKQIITQQLLKWSYWNSSLQKSADKAIRLFPLIFTVKVANKLQNKTISNDEMALFVMVAKSMDDVDNTARLIENFRTMSEDRESTFLKGVKRKLRTINGYASYVTTSFAYTDLFDATAKGSMSLNIRNPLLRPILRSKAEYFEYPDDESGKQLYYEYYGSTELKQPHRIVKITVRYGTGRKLMFGYLRVFDGNSSPLKAIQAGKVSVILPSRTVNAEIVQWDGGKEVLLWKGKIKPTTDRLSLRIRRITDDIKRDYDYALQAIQTFPQRGLDRETEAKIIMMEKQTGRNIKDLKNIRGARYEQLLVELLRSVGPAYFNKIDWHGLIDNKYGVPRHAPAGKSDVAIWKDNYELILEPTLAPPTQQQGRDISVQQHVENETSNGRLPRQIDKVIGIFLCPYSFNPSVLRNFRNDTNNIICSLTTDEFIKFLTAYRVNRNFSKFVRNIMKYHKRT